MKNFFGGVAVGALLCGAAIWLTLIPFTRANYRAVGFNDGQIVARFEIASLIEKELGTALSKSEIKQRLYDVKDVTVVVVDRQGVKTLRTDRY